MSVEQKIIDNSQEKIKALAPRAAKAFKTPDSGIKILVKGAYFVIRDCAMVTTKYLPIMLYGKFENPTKDLSGKFTRKEVEAMITRGKTEPESKQLAQMMAMDSYKVTGPPVAESPEPQPEVINEADIDDVYGDYGSDVIIEEPEEISVDFGDDNMMVELICKAFNIK